MLKPIEITVSEFIQGTLIGAYKEIAWTNSYIGFILISGGIEFLGKCLDDNVEFDYWDRNLRHFDKAIIELFDNTNYQSSDFRANVRNGFAHALKHKKDSNIGLASRERDLSDEERSKNPGNFCNVKGSTKKIVFIEDFYFDYKKACEKVLEKIKNGELTHSKITEPFIIVSNDELDI